MNLIIRRVVFRGILVRVATSVVFGIVGVLSVESHGALLTRRLISMTSTK